MECSWRKSRLKIWRPILKNYWTGKGRSIQVYGGSCITPFLHLHFDEIMLCMIPEQVSNTRQCLAIQMLKLCKMLGKRSKI